MSDKKTLFKLFRFTFEIESFRVNLAQYKIQMHKELWCVVLDLFKIEKKSFCGESCNFTHNYFVKCILINHSSFQIEVYFILHVYFIQEDI